MMNTTFSMEEIFKDLGGAENYLGYHYLLYIFHTVYESKRCPLQTTKELYAETAIHYRTSIYCVERDIRTVIRKIYTKGNRELLKKIMLVKTEECPTNTEFIRAFLRYMERR